MLVHAAQPAARTLAGPDRSSRRSIACSGWCGSAESGESKLRRPRGGFHQVSPGPGRTCAPSDAISPSIVVHAVDLILWDEFDTGRASGSLEGVGRGPGFGVTFRGRRCQGRVVEFDEGRAGTCVGDQCLCGALRGSLKRGTGWFELQ